MDGPKIHCTFTPELTGGSEGLTSSLVGLSRYWRIKWKFPRLMTNLHYSGFRIEFCIKKIPTLFNCPPWELRAEEENSVSCPIRTQGYFHRLAGWRGAENQRVTKGKHSLENVEHGNLPHTMPLHRFQLTSSESILPASVLILSLF